MRIHAIKVKQEFKKQDFWIGCYWEIRRKGTIGLSTERVYHLWICFLPMFPLHISWKNLNDIDKRGDVK